jgi:hydroxymethylbilane synthase
MATTQSQMIADLYTARTGREIELVGITTFGDVTKAQLSQLGGTGVFVSALRDKLVEGEIDFAVHSLKDLPTKQDPRFTLAALPERHDVRDALVGRTKFADLAPGAKVGTDLDYVPIRGNADTRIGKVTSGELDAVVLAAAGLTRIGRQGEISQIFEVEELLPAPGQGALAVECLSTRSDLVDFLSVLDDPRTRSAVTAERAVLSALEAGCSAPVGAFALDDGHTLNLTAVVVSLDGREAVRKSAAGSPSEAMELGRDLAAAMIADGADRLMGEHSH